MTFFETFGAVFTATIMGQVSTWWFKKEVEYRLDKHYDRLKHGIRKNVNILEVQNMGKKMKVQIEKTVNGMYLVDVILKEGNILNKPEYETLSFKDTHELAAWIEKKLE